MIIILGFLASILISCDSQSIITPDDNNSVTQDTILKMVWSTRMNYEKEIVNLAGGRMFGDWYLRSGDWGDNVTIMAFNKYSGKKDWELELPEIDGYEITYMEVYKHILLARNAYHVFAIDIVKKELLWMVRLRDMNIRLGRMNLAQNEKLYVVGDFSFGSPSQVLHMYEFDPYTGAYKQVFVKAPDSTGIYSCSPPAVWNHPETGKEVLVFNLFPDSFAPPEQGSQYIVGIDPEDRYHELFRIPVVDKFASNGGHPPVIYNNTVITGGWDNIYCFNLLTGEKIWEKSFGYPYAIWSKTNHLLYDNRLYVNNGQFDVTCLNPINGIELWNNPQGGPNSTDNMVYYEKEDLLVFTSWGYGSVMVLDGLTGETIHRERAYEYSHFNNDVVYDKELDMFFTSTHKHAMGFTITRPTR